MDLGKISLIGSIYIFYKQESCVLNCGFTAKYFNLKKGARQSDSISAYLFTLALEILFLIIKNDSSIKGIKFLTTFSFIWHMPMIQR